MKLANLQIALITPLIIGGLSACTTVDLSQVAIEQPQVSIEKPNLNVVERASQSLTSTFRAKGWCKTGPEEKTRTATNVLLNGIGSGQKNTPVPVATLSRAQLSAELTDANTHVVQATKAAEVYLVMADAKAELDNELSLLETALLSAREAETRFDKALEKSGGFMARRKLKILSKSVDNLKNVTDAYGDRIRQQIAARASASRS